MALTSTVPTEDNPWSLTVDDPGTGTTKHYTTAGLQSTDTTSPPKQGITDPSVSSTTPAATTTPDPDLTSTDPAARIDALYKQAGIKDYGRGSGFADRAYWLEHPDQIMNGRLAADLAGTGTDQPTGTPGYGSWINSGKSAPESAVGQPTRDAATSFWLSQGNNPNVNNPGTQFAAGSSRPTSPDPPGYHWDDSQARYVADGTTATTASSTTTGASTPTASPSGTGPSTPSGANTVPSSLGTVNPGGNVTPLPQAGSPTTAEPTLDYRTMLLNQLTGGGAGGTDPMDPLGAKP
jgi:hypothetical protein